MGVDGDTVKLLKECDSGIQMGISAINKITFDIIIVLVYRYEK